MVDRLAPEELRRLNSWAGTIAQTLRPEAVVALTPEGLRLGRKGSLSIAATGKWYSHEAGQGGKCAVSLIKHLRECSAAEAVSWARGWLAEHPGDGALSAEGAAEAAAQASELRAAYARQCLDEAIEAVGMPAETYLRSRGLEPPYPDLVRFLPDARLGEGAIVGIITTPDGEAVGVQLGYLDPDGRKTTILPQRQVFLLNEARQGAFRITAADPAEDAAPMVITEGLEDALSIARSGAAREVLGLPGIGRSGNLDLQPGTEIVVFRDGDVPASEAAKQLGAAVDRWLSAGAKIRIADTPAEADANSILQATGPEELRRLVAEAGSAGLSFDADVVRLARLDQVDYERERAGAAKRHSVRVSFIDAAVKASQAEAEAAAAEADEDETPHPEPVPDLAEVLDDALTEMKQYVAASEHDLAATVLWAVQAHFVHHEKVWLTVSPRLAIQSPDKGCGKSTLLEVLGALTPRPETGSSITASVVFRLIEARKPTLLVDEADRILRANEELIAVLNSSHRRAGSYVWRTEEVAGQRIPWKFSTWSPCAFAGIRELPSTLQDRSIVIRLNRAKPGEVTGHLRNGTSPALRMLKRKIIRWTADTVCLPEPQLPAGLHNRQGDNWSPLFSIAEAAGGRWPQLVKTAALAGLGADQQDGTLVALLDGIRRAFGERDRLRTRELLDFPFGGR